MLIFSMLHKHRGHQDNQSPDDEALQALGRKINSFNEYLLWAGGQPDYLYAASGDASDYMVSHISSYMTCIICFLQYHIKQMLTSYVHSLHS